MPTTNSAVLGRSRRLERARHFFDLERFQHVADLEVVEVLDADTALETLLHPPDVFLEALQARQTTLVDLAAIPDNPDGVAAPDQAVANEAARDDADSRDLED